MFCSLFFVQIPLLSCFFSSFALSYFYFPSLFFDVPAILLTSVNLTLFYHLWLSILFACISVSFSCHVSFKFASFPFISSHRAFITSFLSARFHDFSPLDSLIFLPWSCHWLSLSFCILLAFSILVSLFFPFIPWHFYFRVTWIFKAALNLDIFCGQQFWEEIENMNLGHPPLDGEALQHPTCSLFATYILPMQHFLLPKEI